jgi:cytochrome c553
MKKLLITLSISALILLNGCNKASDEKAIQSTTSTNTTVTGDAIAGKTLFDTTCSNCHTSATNYIAYNISRPLADIATQKDIINALYTLKYASANATPSRHADMMGVANGLSNTDIINVSAHFYSLKH